MSYDKNMDADLKKSSILNTDYIDLLKIFVEYFKVPLLIRIDPKSEISNLFLPVTSKVSCIRRKRGQIICLQGNNKSMAIFVLKRRKVVR
jgi:hypothetical protein